MFGFGAISEAAFSAQMVTTHPAGASLTGSASLTSAPVLSVSGASLASGPATISAVDVLSHAAKAVISSESPFTNGFTQGFQSGSLLTGNGTVTQTGLSISSTLIANGTIERLASSSLSASATLRLQHAIIADLQSIASLAGNSVLLVSGSASFSTLTKLEEVFQTDDIVSFTVYVDKERDIELKASIAPEFTVYIDQQLSADANIDLAGDITSYIDKVVEKTLVRER